jgi:glycosyltransferase involved in cell wall biosynthesis|tara:strand:- start:19 stop:738 length:720 start_codon:yes stop_codon:yes gene_type:complete
MKIIVGVTLYNSGDVVEKTLGSIMSQTYKNFVCYITDDLSTDNSADIVENFIKGDGRFHLIRNTEKRYQGGNYDLICRDTEGVDDEDVFIEVDGDDWLPDSKVFERVVTHYESGNIWIANGTFRYSDGRKGFSSEIKNFGDLRQKSYTASHLRTWKIFLWRNIKRTDLYDDSGYYWTTTGDLSFMYPMLEMSGEEHYKFMDEINYIYNEQNPLNDHKVNMGKVNYYVNYAKKIKKYDLL